MLNSHCKVFFFLLLVLVDKSLFQPVNLEEINTHGIEDVLGNRKKYARIVWFGWSILSHFRTFTAVSGYFSS